MVQVICYPIIPIYIGLRIETRYIKKFIKEKATIYARLINQCMSKRRILFSARFYKINEEDQRSVEIELFIDLNIDQKVTETDNNKFLSITRDVKSQFLLNLLKSY